MNSNFRPANKFKPQWVSLNANTSITPIPTEQKIACFLLKMGWLRWTSIWNVYVIKSMCCWITRQGRWCGAMKRLIDFIWCPRCLGWLGRHKLWCMRDRDTHWALKRLKATWNIYPTFRSALGVERWCSMGRDVGPFNALDAQFVVKKRQAWQTSDSC